MRKNLLQKEIAENSKAQTGHCLRMENLKQTPEKIKQFRLQQKKGCSRPNLRSGSEQNQNQCQNVSHSKTRFPQDILDTAEEQFKSEKKQRTNNIFPTQAECPKVNWDRGNLGLLKQQIFDDGKGFPNQAKSRNYTWNIDLNQHAFGKKTRENPRDSPVERKQLPRTSNNLLQHHESEFNQSCPQNGNQKNKESGVGSCLNFDYPEQPCSLKVARNREEDIIFGTKAQESQKTGKKMDMSNRNKEGQFNDLIQNSYVNRETNSDRELLKIRSKGEIQEALKQMKVGIKGRDFEDLWRKQKQEQMNVIQFLQMARREGIVH